MQSKQPSWEGAILAFAMMFTVLLGIAYALSVTFRLPIPWLAILIISLVAGLALRFRRRPGS